MSVCLFDPITFFISLVGLFLSLFFILRELFPCVPPPYDEELKKNLSEWLNKDENGEKLKLVLADYETSNEEVRRRDNVHLIIGTILITASFLILGNVALRLVSPLWVFSFTSIGSFSIWLFLLHNTGKKINKITYDRIKTIEAVLSDHFKEKSEECKKVTYEFGIHSYIVRKTHEQRDLWLRGRRSFWGFILLLLSLAWMFLSIF